MDSDFGLMHKISPNFETKSRQKSIYTVNKNNNPFAPLPNSFNLAVAAINTTGGGNDTNPRQHQSGSGMTSHNVPTAPIIVTVNATGLPGADGTQTASGGQVVTIPVPIVPQEDTYVYVMVKGSLHDRSCQVFGLNAEETQAITRRFESSVKNVINGIMVGVPATVMINTLAQLNYKVVCASGEAEICWTLQREV